LAAQAPSPGPLSTLEALLSGSERFSAYMSAVATDNLNWWSGILSPVCSFLRMKALMRLTSVKWNKILLYHLGDFLLILNKKTDTGDRNREKGPRYGLPYIY
jgi:hypothetical protein